MPASLTRLEAGQYYLHPPAPPHEFWLEGQRLTELHRHKQAGNTLSQDDFIEYARLRGISDFYWFAKHAMGFSWLRWPLHGPLAYAWQAPNGGNWIDEYGRVHTYELFRAAVIPRGHLKTSLLTQAYALWRLCRNPEERILIYTMHFEFASVIMNYIRTTLEGGGYHGKFFGDLYGHIIPSPQDRKKWTLNDITLNRDGAYSDYSIKARGCGSRVTGGHHTIQLIDDIVGEELNKTQMAKVLRDFDNLDPLFHSLGFGERRFVGTPWSFFDPITYIEKYWPEAMVARLSWKEPNGELIFPPILDAQGVPIPELGGCDLVKAENLRQRNSWFFSCQYECWPKDEGKIGFQKNWFRYFRQRGEYFYELDGEDREIRKTAIADCNTFIFLDPNTGRENEGGGTQKIKDINAPALAEHDFAAWVVVCVDRDGRWFIPRVVRLHCNVDELMDQTTALVDVWKPIKVCIEQRAAQIFLLALFRKDFRAGRREAFVIDDWEGGNASKPARIKGLIPLYSNGSILHRDNGPVAVQQGISDLESEELAFGGPMDHDDSVDALSAAVKKVYAPGRDAPTLADTKKETAYEATIATLDKASRRAARAWKAHQEPSTDEWFSEGTPFDA